MTKIPTCFICGQQVLGLVGQDLRLDTFYLHDEPEDREVLSAEAFGDCHLSCLIDSTWGAFWARRIAENLEHVRNFAVVSSDNDVTIFRNEGMRESVAVRTDGWVANFSDKAVRSGHAVADGVFVPVAQELTLPITAHPDVADRAGNALLSSGSFALPELVKALRLADYLLYPDAIRDGELRLLPSGKYATQPVTRTRGEVYLTAVAHLHQLMPDDVAPRIAEHVAETSS